MKSITRNIKRNFFVIILILLFDFNELDKYALLFAKIKKDIFIFFNSIIQLQDSWKVVLVIFLLFFFVIIIWVTRFDFPFATSVLFLLGGSLVVFMMSVLFFIKSALLFYGVGIVLIMSSYCLKKTLKKKIINNEWLLKINKL